MERQALAVKYRPKTFEDVCEQGAIITILRNQLNTSTFKHAYLFTGPAGCGKTTCARIFANEINKGQGNPLEMDAASNSGVDDVRKIISQAQTQSIDSEFKVFIIDECHAISNVGWQAFLKLIEEPPAKSIFIFCTTDPQKIPATIISRVQRYDFTRISSKSIVSRLRYICDREVTGESGLVRLEALEYIAKVANGGMRDAITLLDKCLSYTNELTAGAVNEVLGNIGFTEMLDFIEWLHYGETKQCLEFVNQRYMQGFDIKQFINQLYSTLLEISIYWYTKDVEIAGIPYTGAVEYLNEYDAPWYESVLEMLSEITKIKSDLRWESNAKMRLDAWVVLRGAK